MPSEKFLIRARVLVPVSQPPIHEGAVFVSGDRVAAIGPWNELSSQHPDVRVVDLTDQIVLPGLINAHCHLDYTRMAGGIPPKKSFSDWIKAILAYKADWSYTDFAESWVAGANMLLRTGTTTVLDIEAVPELLEEASSSTPLRVISALEMTGIRSEKTPAQIVDDSITSSPETLIGDGRVALSPHSLYSTKPELVKRAAEEAAIRNWLLTTHVSESTEETEMFVNQRGPMFDWLQTQRDMSDCRNLSPVAMLNELRVLSDRFIAVHGNCLTDEDITLLAEHNCSVVHCPRSHDYFRHPAFPLERLQNAGVNICLGTDSLASVRGTNRTTIELNMFTEMQSLAKASPGVSAETIVRMATMNGAKALKRENELGHIAPGTFADLIAIPTTDENEDVYTNVVQCTDSVTAIFIAGQQMVAVSN